MEQKENVWTSHHEYFKRCEKYNGLLVTKSFYIDETWWLLTTIGLIAYNTLHPCESNLYTFSQNYNDNAISDGQYKGHNIFAVSNNIGVQIFDTKRRHFQYDNYQNEKVDYVYLDTKINFGNQQLKRNQSNSQHRSFDKSSSI